MMKKEIASVLWYSTTLSCIDPFLLQCVRDCSLRVFKTMISALAMEGVY